MTPASFDPQSQARIETARSLVLEWLRDPKRDPQFLIDPPESALADSHRHIADRFLHWMTHSGFEAQLVEIQHDGRAEFEVNWTHHGATFVGFKQAPPAGNPADAVLLGCAALLKNDWCRRQIQQ